MTLRKIFYVLCGLALLAGVGLRVYHLQASGLFFYDEANYLHHDLPVLELIKANPPHTLTDAWGALRLYLRIALASGKSLWFMVSDLRFLWGGIHDWAFPKAAAAFFGLWILPLTFLFSRRYFGSRDVAWLSVALAAVLPAMVFYSRIGLQEALSTCLVLTGFYCYLFPGKFGWRTIGAGVLLSLAFFANYRLILLPVILLALELWEGFVLRKGFNVRRYCWWTLTFFAGVVLVGNLFDGGNTQIIFAWVFHQEEMAPGSFSWVNFLSYPYYFFQLETWLFGAAFFGACGWLIARFRERSLPLVLVLVQMLVFSLPSEKGARYVCVMLPFAVMTVAFAAITLCRHFQAWQRWIVPGLVVVMAVGMVFKSWEIASARSAYAEATAFMDELSPGSKFLSSQDVVQSLYVWPYVKRVAPAPARFDRLTKEYAAGYHYLVLDPQAYVGLTTGVRFKTDLRDYLGFIDSRLTPLRVFPHMNHAMLERFVFEHSENLVQSIRFLADKDVVRMASIRVYDLAPVMPAMEKLYEQLLKARK